MRYPVKRKTVNFKGNQFRNKEFDTLREVHARVYKILYVFLE